MFAGAALTCCKPPPFAQLVPAAGDCMLSNEWVMHGTVVRARDSFQVPMNGSIANTSTACHAGKFWLLSLLACSA